MKPFKICEARVISLNSSAACWPCWPPFSLEPDVQVAFLSCMVKDGSSPYLAAPPLHPLYLLCIPECRKEKPVREELRHKVLSKCDD